MKDHIAICYCREGVPKLKQFLKHLGMFHSMTSKLYLLPIKVFWSDLQVIHFKMTKMHILVYD